MHCVLMMHHWVCTTKFCLNVSIVLFVCKSMQNKIVFKKNLAKQHKEAMLDSSVHFTILFTDSKAIDDIINGAKI